MRTCKKCSEEKPLEDFYRNENSCRPCKNAIQRERRKSSNNQVTKVYEKTPNGFLMRLYRNMQSRITGVQKEKHYLYAGKELLSREEFYDWAKPNEDFHKLFDEWVKSGYDRKLTPSVDRVESSKGYIISNMEWVTHSENSGRANWTKYNRSI